MADHHPGPEKPLGTHVFTAFGHASVRVRWGVISMYADGKSKVAPEPEVRLAKQLRLTSRRQSGLDRIAIPHDPARPPTWCCQALGPSSMGLNMARLSRMTFRGSNSPIPVVCRGHIRERYDYSLLGNLCFRMRIEHAEAFMVTRFTEFHSNAVFTAIAAATITLAR